MSDGASTTVRLVRWTVTSGSNVNSRAAVVLAAGGEPRPSAYARSSLLSAQIKTAFTTKTRENTRMQ